MKSGEISNTFGNKKNRMTLRGYYRNLPEPTYPKKEFIRTLAIKCNVTETTVRNWVMYGIKPENKRYVDIISEVTGISPEDLWMD